MSRKRKKVCASLNHVKDFLFLASAITGCISISSFASLISSPIRVTDSIKGLKTCAMAAGIKRYKSIVKKKKNKHDKTVLSAKSVSNKALFNLNISHDEFDLTNNVLKEYDNMTEEKKYLKTYSLSWF